MLRRPEIVRRAVGVALVPLGVGGARTQPSVGQRSPSAGSSNVVTRSSAAVRLPEASSTSTRTWCWPEVGSEERTKLREVDAGRARRRAS